MFSVIFALKKRQRLQGGRPPISRLSSFLKRLRALLKDEPPLFLLQI
jgi:hypothetical protein